MSAAVNAGDALNFDAIIDAFYQHGWVWLPNFLSTELNSALLHEAQHEAELTPAGIGRLGDHQLNQQVRRDATQWFDGQSTAQQRYLALMAQLQTVFNRRCFLGLFDFECHFALYPSGAFYRRHLDRFRDEDRRMVSAVIYLNEDWLPEQGGALRIEKRQRLLLLL